MRGLKTLKGKDVSGGKEVKIESAQNPPVRGGEKKGRRLAYDEGEGTYLQDYTRRSQLSTPKERKKEGRL